MSESIADAFMHSDTLAAAKRLAECLAAHPNDLAEAEVYGGLAEHLADLLHDHEEP
jgi:hypothetical protein